MGRVVGDPVLRVDGSFGVRASNREAPGVGLARPADNSGYPSTHQVLKQADADGNHPR